MVLIGVIVLWLIIYPHQRFFAVNCTEVIYDLITLCYWFFIIPLQIKPVCVPLCWWQILF